MKGGTELPGGEDREPRPSESGPGETEEAQEVDETEEAGAFEVGESIDKPEVILTEGTVLPDGTVSAEREYTAGPLGEEVLTQKKSFHDFMGEVKANLEESTGTYSRYRSPSGFQYNVEDTPEYYKLDRMTGVSSEHLEGLNNLDKPFYFTTFSTYEPDLQNIRDAGGKVDSNGNVAFGDLPEHLDLSFTPSGGSVRDMRFHKRVADLVHNVFRVEGDGTHGPEFLRDAAEIFETAFTNDPMPRYAFFSDNEDVVREIVGPDFHIEREADWKFFVYDEEPKVVMKGGRYFNSADDKDFAIERSDDLTKPFVEINAGTTANTTKRIIEGHAGTNFIIQSPQYSDLNRQSDETSKDLRESGAKVYKFGDRLYASYDGEGPTVTPQELEIEGADTSILEITHPILRNTILLDMTEDNARISGISGLTSNHLGMGNEALDAALRGVGNRRVYTSPAVARYATLKFGGSYYIDSDRGIWQANSTSDNVDPYGKGVSEDSIDLNEYYRDLRSWYGTILDTIREWDGGSIHGDINKFLETGEDLFSKNSYSAGTHHLNDLNALFRQGHPVKDTPMYRGIKYVSPEQMDEYVQGDTLVWWGMPSMSWDINVARYFLTEDGKHPEGRNGVFFTVHGHEAADISWADVINRSEWDWEQENLNKPGSEYLIKSVEEVHTDAKGGRIIHVTLQGEHEFGNQESQIPEHWDWSYYWNPKLGKQYETEEEWSIDEP